MKTKIGIVTPTLNAAAYLEQCLDSIWESAAQSSTEIDHVVVDGGSNDRTTEIVRSYPSRLIQDPRPGMYTALNRGFEEVGGNVLGYLNADDRLLPETLAVVSREFRAKPNAAWLTGSMNYIQSDGVVTCKRTPVDASQKALLAIGWSTVCQPATWFKREFWEKVGCFDEQFKYCGDYDWFARALSIEKPILVKQVLAEFREHGSNLSNNFEEMRKESHLVRAKWPHIGDRATLDGLWLKLRVNLVNLEWYLTKIGKRMSTHS